MIPEDGLAVGCASPFLFSQRKEEIGMKVVAAVAAVAGMLGTFSAGAHAGIDDAKAQALMKQGGCTTCHSIDKKSMGPAFKDVAQKRKGQAEAIAGMEKSVRSGSKGVYGAMPMPAVSAAKLGDADLHDLLEWVLTK
jgi:cytochrome c